MAASWFVRGAGKVYGPLDDNKLRELVAEQKIDDGTDVSRSYEGPWVPAGRVRGLFPSDPTPPPYQSVGDLAPQVPPDRKGVTSPSAPLKDVLFIHTWAGIGVIWGVVLFLGLVAMGLRSSAQQKKAALQRVMDNPVASVEADVLYEMFRRNSVKSESLLTHRAVVVSGTVNTIGKDIYGMPYVGIGKGLAGTVLCTFPKDRSAAVGDMSKGEVVKIKGLVKGQNVLGQVEMYDCCPSITGSDK
jgi:hypothetical protein